MGQNIGVGQYFKPCGKLRDNASQCASAHENFVMSYLNCTVAITVEG